MHPLGAVVGGRGRCDARGNGATEKDETHAERDRRRGRVEGDGARRAHPDTERRAGKENPTGEQDRSQHLRWQLGLRHAPESLQRAAAEQQQGAERHERARRPDCLRHLGGEVSPVRPYRHSGNQRDRRGGAGDASYRIAQEASQQTVLVLAFIRADESDRGDVELQLADQHCDVHPREQVAVHAVAGGPQRARQHDLHDE